MILNSMENNFLKNEVFNYLTSKIKKQDEQKVNTNGQYFELFDRNLERIRVGFYIWDYDNRVSVFLEDLEVIDEYDAEINEIIKYIDFILVHEIKRYEEYCNDKLVSRYYEYYRNSNGETIKEKEYDVNDFSFFCKKIKNVKQFIPW